MQKIELLNVTGTDPEKIFVESEVFIDEVLPKPPIAISIGTTEYKNNTVPLIYGSYGDYSCIIGASKAKKTFLKSAILAGYIGGKATNYFQDIRGHQTEKKYVIDIDTEQSRYHSQKVFRRVIEMVGRQYPYYKCFGIREYTPKERFAFISWLLTESKYKDQLGIVSIDGLADLIDDFNSLEQSNMLQQHLLNWSSEANAHIIGILHRNFGSEKPVGHIGSAILKKAETVVFTEPENKLIKVQCKYSRNYPFEDFAFTINDDGLPQQSNDYFADY